MLIDTLQLSDAKSIAICGGGGKTTLLYALSEEFRALGNAVLCTTSTHILQPQDTDVLTFSPLPKDAVFHAEQGKIIVYGMPCGQNKITGIPPMMIDAAKSAADILLYEADGSRHLPLKCHRPQEPVVWFGTDAVICVIGMSAFGQPAENVCHCHTLDPLFSIMPYKPIDTDDLIRLALECRKAAGYPHLFRVCFNQCDTEELLQAAAQASAELSLHGILCMASCFHNDPPRMTAL